ncbi:MAG: DUF3570 domain-containing protein [Burkholderiales bacterium]
MKKIKSSKRAGRASEAGALLTAALALPGLGIGGAQAGNAPEEGVIGFKYLYYEDYQPSTRRMKILAPSVHASKTIGGDWVVQGQYVIDSVSGASPAVHSSVSGASKIQDTRRAGDVKLTRYFDRSALGVSIAASKEDDYRSRALGLDYRIFSENKNTTYAFGIGGSSDDIQATNEATKRGSKSTREGLVGITQVLSATDIVQSNITYTQGNGYFNDPYKTLDQRPRDRRQLAWLIRWNHHFTGSNATLRTSYRYYQDSWGVKSSAVAGEWVQPIGRGLSVVPNLRYASQSASTFYRDPPFPNGYTATGFYSADQRLSAFGAITTGLKVIMDFPGGWSVDLKAEYYEQRGAWRIFGEGSPGLEPFKAQMYQLGVSTKF